MTNIEIKVEQISKGLGQAPSLLTTRSVSANTKRVGITTLGCKVNTFESELIGETLKTDDWNVVPNTEAADLYLINTCTVTREADRQARQEVRKAIKRNPDALVVVTGCYAQMDPDACAEIPGVDLVLGNDRKLDMHRLLPQLEQGELPKVMVGDLDQHVSLPDQLLTAYEAHTRAFVQIQQGCDQGCTFCIIHVARGPSRSLAPSLIKRQVQRLVLNGYPEIVICGVDLGSYGEDFLSAEGSLSAEGFLPAEGSASPAEGSSLLAESSGTYGDDLSIDGPDNNEQGFDLVDLLQELLQLEHAPDNPFRIRLSSIDPHHITDKLIDLWAHEPRLCPHMHLSLQSGNSLILKRMKRRYDAYYVRERIAKLRSLMPELVISADVMVGFPTETEEQYLDTEQMLRDIEVVFPHTFSYSEREGTPAARIPADRQVPIAERKQRNLRLREAAQPLQVKLRNSKVGEQAWVLPEKASKRDGFTMCRAEDYLAVLVPSEQLTVGRWQQVAYQAVDGEFLIAEAIV